MEDEDSSKFELNGSDHDRFRSFYRNLVKDDNNNDTIRFFTQKASQGVRFSPSVWLPLKFLCSHLICVEIDAKGHFWE